MKQNQNAIAVIYVLDFFLSRLKKPAVVER